MNGINEKIKPLLSICIPTWNRAHFLRISLNNLLKQVSKKNSTKIELFISDNCSDDNTQEVVNEFIMKGLPIVYNRNDENIGAAGNFVKCINWSSGKYILLLGDDDVLKEGALDIILDSLRDKDYGLLHIHKNRNLTEERINYTDTEVFLKQISFWITFMSGNIFRRDIVGRVDISKYVETHLLQVPFFITSALSQNNNLILNMELMEEGLDDANNGGYNFYEVFVRNYLSIWAEFREKGNISQKTYEFLKKHLYINMIIKNNYRFLVRHRNVKPENMDYIGNRSGFKIAGATQILKNYYGNTNYRWVSFYYYLKFFVKESLGLKI